MIRTLINRLLKKESSLERAYRNGFKTGKNFVCYSPYAIDANWPWLISCGDDVLISSDVKILAHDASPCKAGVSTKIGLVTIGNNVFIGAGSIILCNTKIGNNVIIGAGSVVSHDIPSDSVYAGNPAQWICSFDDYQKKHQMKHEEATIFDEYQWDEWINAPEKNKLEMKQKLKNGCGYLT